MQPDPAIDEIREVRRKISAEFGNDPQRLVAHYMELEREARRTGKQGNKTKTWFCMTNRGRSCHDHDRRDKNPVNVKTRGLNLPLAWTILCLCPCLTGFSQTTNSLFQFVQNQSQRHYTQVPHEVLKPLP
jgi:hypothetical protein